MAGLNDVPLIQNLAVPSVSLLIAFLGYFPQYVFHRSTTLDPGPPSRTESVVFNALLLCLWFAYLRTVTVDPGRYIFSAAAAADPGSRWCRKCAFPKPLRAHHCRHCGRCIPKMDHHCPWARNCVSMTTFPHFLRFLVYSNLSLWTLASLLWQRFYALWEARHLPAYLGPSLQALMAMALTSLTCLVTALALGIMLVTTVRAWVFNCTMIEGWELERHEAIVARDGRDWWQGQEAPFERVEFPYDIGFFANMSQAMGTSNPFLWLSPFAGNPRVDAAGRGMGWSWEENGFNRKLGMWPPPDPEKMRRAVRLWPASQGTDPPRLPHEELSPAEQKRALKQRQYEDEPRRRSLLSELEEVDDCNFVDEANDSDEESHRGPEERSRWINFDSERLQDYGVEEAEGGEAEDLHDQDVPLGELLRRRRVDPSDEAT